MLEIERCAGAGADAGYLLNPAYWGRGIATAAVKTLTDLAYSGTNLHRVQATIYSPNFASARVAKKSGYTREACLRDALSKNREIYDAPIYARLRRDLPLQ